MTVTNENMALAKAWPASAFLLSKEKFSRLKSKIKNIRRRKKIEAEKNKDWEIERGIKKRQNTSRASGRC